ncbi:MAG: response regulator, partial [Acidobacteriota bacterium]|nr:response regulator [Acidobacteriota bacterium]
MPPNSSYNRKDQPLQIDGLRILLVEEDNSRADKLVSLLFASRHSATPVASLDEATEALSIQKFDAVLLGSSYPRENVAGFARKLRDLGERSGSLITFLSCSPGASDVAQFDAHLSDGFDFAALVDLVGRLCSDAKGPGVAQDSDAPVLPVFNPEDFGEQCAQEKDLMVEIIDLFSAECEAELPAMGEALALNDFERLSRFAHTIKGSLASL